MNRLIALLTLMVVAFAPALVLAQSLVEEPPPRRQAAIPPGFVRIEVGNRTVLAEPQDEAWVREHLKDLKAFEPTAVPGELLARLREKQDEIVQDLAEDLVLTDKAAIASQIESEVIEPLRKLQNVHPPVLYLATTIDRLRELLRNGWEDPNFYYNRAADAVVRATAIGLRIDAPMDDAVIGAIYADADTPDQRGKVLVETITTTENDVTMFLSASARSHVGAGFANVINELAVRPLNLRDDQRWYGLGLDIILASKHSAPITDQPLPDLLRAMSVQNPQNPLRFDAVDLLNPPDVNIISPDAAPFYVDAVRRKSAAVMLLLVEKAGHESIPRTLAAIRAKAPEDGKALVQLINELYNIDLTNSLTN